jgi:hypothetical protein
MEEAVRTAATMAEDIAPLVDGTRLATALHWLADNEPDQARVNHFIRITEEAIEQLLAIQITLKEALLQ